MRSYVLRAPIDVVRQDDGSYIAMGKSLPIFVVAPTLEELQARIARLAPTISKYLEEQGPDPLESAKGMGLRLEPIDDGRSLSEGAVDVPIVVSV